MGMTNWRRGLLAGAAVAAVAGPAWAQTKTFDIPAQEALTGIPAFARQAGVQIFAPEALVRGKRTHDVRGAYPVAQGVAMLLEGTGLSAQETKPQVWTVVSRPQDEAAGAAANTVSELTVTGTNLRGVDVPAPTIVVSRNEIQNTGVSTLQEIFDQLPQNFSGISPQGRTANEGGSLLAAQNNQRVTAIDLRGLGAQSTLTLINGTRRAGNVGGRVVDISNIPLSAVEKVEIVTGGRSAIYGADAVAGVVNVVMRRSFDGLESQAYFGAAGKRGGERMQFSQIGGRSFDRGGFMVALDYSHDRTFNLADSGLLTLRPTTTAAATQLSYNAQAATWRTSGLISGHYNISDSAELFGDASYSRKRFEDFLTELRVGAPAVSWRDLGNVAEDYSFSGGVKLKLAHDWRVTATAVSSTTDNDRDEDARFFLATSNRVVIANYLTKTSVESLSAVAEGPLFELLGVAPRLAVGAEQRWERINDVTSSASALPPVFTVTRSPANRTITSAFAELSAPVTLGGQRLEFSVAGRVDDYSDFGSSFNPQAGFVWRSGVGLTAKAAYATAFRAPALVETRGAVSAAIRMVADPTRGGLPSPILYSEGVNTDLGPEEAETWSLALEYKPPFARWLYASVSYFDVRYDGRIERPSVNADLPLVLARADRYASILNRAPTAEQARAILTRAQTFTNGTTVAFNPATQDPLTVFPGLITFDNRTTNIAVEKLQALDFVVETNFATSVGAINLGVNAAYTLDRNRSLTPDSPKIVLLNEVGKPVDLRIRGKAGWTRGAYGAFAYVNYADSYKNPFSAPVSKMPSWTTVDLTLRFDGSRLAAPGLLDGITVALSATNLFDKGPPRFDNSFLGIYYDVANASPMGRYSSIRISKRW